METGKFAYASSCCGAVEYRTFRAPSMPTMICRACGQLCSLNLVDHMNDEYFQWLQQFERWEDNPTRAASQIKAEMQQQVLEYLEQTQSILSRPPVTPEYVEVIRRGTGEWVAVKNFADYYAALRHGSFTHGFYIVPTEEAARLTAEGATAREPRVFLARGVFP